MVGVMAQHAGEAFVQVFAGGSWGFSRVWEAFQEVDLCDSAPRRCNRVRPDTASCRVVSVTDPVSIHLKEFDLRETRGLQLVVHMERGAEVSPLVVEGAGAGIGDVSSSDGSLRSAEMTDEITSEGGWHSVQEPCDCSLSVYLRLKKGRNWVGERSKRREASSAMVLRWPG